MIIIYLAVVYILAVFVFLRFIIPHLGFWEENISEEIPAEMLEKINQLKGRANNQKEFLDLTYDYLGSKFHSERFNTILKFDYLFIALAEAWQMDGYLPCTLSNYLLKIFLVKSGWFKEADIRRRHVFVNFVPHQYLKVKLGENWLDVDVGEKQRGLPIGKHLKYFG